ncbi:MAG: hypothetical protein HY308_16950 [Gammaproteobacteria bacterium]|nr:hypothetical protein [Gammaproteobacteria bacterium]
MLVQIAAYLTPLEAHLARGRLDAEGVPAFVCHEHHAGLLWTWSLALGEVKLYVNHHDAGRAVEILSAHDRGEYALDDEAPIVCPRCQSTQIDRHRVSWKAAFLVVHIVQLPLYFQWATLRCKACAHEWDLPSSRAYRYSAIAVVILLIGIAAAFLLTTFCVGGTKYWLIFRQVGVCR